MKETYDRLAAGEGVCTGHAEAVPCRLPETVIPEKRNAAVTQALLSK